MYCPPPTHAPLAKAQHSSVDVEVVERKGTGASIFSAKGPQRPSVSWAVRDSTQPVNSLFVSQQCSCRGRSGSFPSAHISVCHKHACGIERSGGSDAGRGRPTASTSLGASPPPPPSAATAATPYWAPSPQQGVRLEPPPPPEGSAPVGAGAGTSPARPQPVRPPAPGPSPPPQTCRP
jgi:hypothetical protein